ncbi:glycine betaine/L-proline ABC transporter substrate-binding protein ProX [Hydrogenophaga sp. BPS33]|uniref:glycine betaine/L-proline ABC transporter substrate-binding protein ProX n=1 Tax=Hydrogenophaga sp. BPS33 TaxID=2651974 RepID=UPI00131FF985|nr:glycine betaine/L-proline ABC transporter substrate-binding protein ProX [Hydrogenophaga sp. BPS33]QHE86480.1 glycine betaine/L-proline ABC transporter substrate-binding protein ProX [Hydrogenophaga sp. BPS33]
MTMTTTTRHLARSFLATGLLAWGLASAQAANDLPGKGVQVLPLQSNLSEESFQTVLVTRALKRLGYDVQPIKEVEYPMAHIAVANGDATFMANHWNPHHSEFYKSAGGDDKLSRKGVYARGATQGYMIDRKTADRYKITHLSQLTDPKLAKLFDTTGDGKANLIGPSAGWGGEAVVNHQLGAYKLQGTVTYTQGNYPALIADTVARFKQGQPVLFYAWTPYWLSNVLRPGIDVVWLEVPFSAMPGVQAGTNTKQTNGRDYGFPVNNEYIVANKAWVAKHPAAARLFEVMELPVADISAQNQRMRQGENRPQDIERHTDAWIKAHQKTFDGWIAQALAAAEH